MMNAEEISMEDKFALLQKLFTPTSPQEKNFQPVILGLKQFNPDEISAVQVVDSMRSTITVTKKGEQPVQYQGAQAVNYLTEKAGWKICAMMLVARDNYGQVVQDLLTVLVLPKLPE